MATQAQDNFTSGGRGASNAAGSLSAGQTVTAWSPASGGPNWIAQTAPSGAGQMSHQRTAMNVPASGAMPLTTGAITNTTKAPGMDIVFNQGTP